MRQAATIAGRCALAAGLGLALAPPLPATGLNVQLRSGASSTVSVAPGGVVAYQVVGELSDSASDGLALFSIDLAFDGGPLAPASPPAAAPMTSFAVPAGVNNPQGFGGRVVAGHLVQVGGGQNTLNNSFGAYPLGAVTTGVAQAGAPVTLVAGALTAPLAPGTYTLSVTRVVANVIAAGATGIPVWKVAPAGAGSLSPLTINVVATGRAVPAPAPAKQARR